MSIEIQKEGDILSSLAKTQCSNLTLYLDNLDLLDEIGPKAIDFILEAYHRAYHRFLKFVLGEQKETIPDSAFPIANIVITRDSGIFRELYHPPSGFNDLPDWVRGYVNFKRSLYVQWLKAGEVYNPTDLDGKVHEFTHTVIPHILGLPAAYLDQAWPIWIHEGFTVGLNQRKPLDWIRRELQSTTVKQPTTSSIQEKGIFSHDIRRPATNIAYQYCYLVAEEVGNDIRSVFYPQRRDIPPLMAVSDLTQRAFRQGQTDFVRALDGIGLNVTTAENRCREKIGLPLVA